MTDEPDTLRPKQARELLGVSRTYLHNKTVDGTIPSFRIGKDGPLRYSRRALLALIVHQGARGEDQ